MDNSIEVSPLLGFGRILNLKHLGIFAASAALAAPISAGYGQDGASQSCSASSGWSQRVSKFRAMPLSKQLKKVSTKNGVVQTHGIGAKRVMGIIDGRLRSFLEYSPMPTGPLYRLVLDENVIGSSSVNDHYAYKVGLMIDGQYVELNKANQEPAYPICGANNQCTTQMTSYYVVSPDIFAKIEGMSDETILPLRIERAGMEYRPCRDFIAAGEFKLLRSAIEQGAK